MSKPSSFIVGTFGSSGERLVPKVATGVTLPALTYKTEPTVIANTSKGLVEGQMTGRYEDLRRFIYGLETAEELLFIEDLELARPGGAQDALLTFNIKIATYLRDHTGESNLPRPAQ